MTEPASLAAVRESYDTVAAAYAARVPPPAELDPLSRAVLAEFAGRVRTGAPVADAGCGPGKVTAHLADLGVPAFGLDLSPRMIELARGAYPHLHFTVASMTALPVADDSLAGVLAYYSTHHLPPDALPPAFAEFHRALAPGGTLLLAGHAGPPSRILHTRAYGNHPVRYETHLRPPSDLAALLRAAGLTLTAQLTQEPTASTKHAIATFLARKPSRR